MRDGFREIVSGWMLIDDFDDLTDRIERSAEWAKANGPLEEDEQATVTMMVESQIARGIRRGDFEPFIAGEARTATTLRPRAHFNPLLINWGGPDEPRTDRCSYCGDPFPTDDDDFAPLIISNAQGWAAEFCDHCQATWFGVQTFDPLPDEVVEGPSLGPCCMCAGDGVNIIMLDRRAVIPGHGWGCFICGLPRDGAVAVLCNGCADRFEADPTTLRRA